MYLFSQRNSAFLLTDPTFPDRFRLIKLGNGVIHQQHLPGVSLPGSSRQEALPHLCAFPKSPGNSRVIAALVLLAGCGFVDLGSKPPQIRLFTESVAGRENSGRENRFGPGDCTGRCSSCTGGLKKPLTNSVLLAETSGESHSLGQG